MPILPVSVLTSASNSRQIISHPNNGGACRMTCKRPHIFPALRQLLSTVFQRYVGYLLAFNIFRLLLILDSFHDFRFQFLAELGVVSQQRLHGVTSLCQFGITVREP